MKKKYFLNAACLCLCAGFAFTACNKDDDGPEASPIESITATVENGSSYDLDQVKASIDYAGGSYEVVSGSYTNGGFTLTLPKTVDARYLKPLFDEEDLELFGSGIKVSDTNAKTAFLYIAGYKSNVPKGSFWYIKELSASSEIEAEIVYVDRDVTVTGSGTFFGDKEVMNISLKKGWNMWYDTETTTGTTTERTSATSDPGGLKWIFYKYGGNDDPVEDDHAEDPIPEQGSAAKFFGSKKFPFKSLK
ncbi:MAG: hypothetical protein LBL04_11915 [Bacteroidales bacterium]|jgi:hypothetical protein|nr:hypothetical protein [Bacteroidales bacterium]